jgi:CheY-like chemotaxis protein
MSGDLVSLRILVLSASMPERDLMRQGAAAASVPVDALEADSIASARMQLTTNDIDVVFVGGSIPIPDCTAFIAGVRTMKTPPFVFLTAANQAEAQGLAATGADGAIINPANIDEAKRLVERCVHLRLPHRVLVVDDSLTMRSIVRKILVASRFKLDTAEAEEGIDALKQISSGKFDLVFLDYNMPGLNGVETLSEIKRQYPKLAVVLMTSQAEEELAARARAAGAAAFLKKPFYPADIDAILHRIFGLQAQR